MGGWAGGQLSGTYAMGLAALNHLVDGMADRDRRARNDPRGLGAPGGGKVDEQSSDEQVDRRLLGAGKSFDHLAAGGGEPRRRMLDHGFGLATAPPAIAHAELPHGIQDVHPHERGRADARTKAGLEGLHKVGVDDVVL